jgi:hypothetical protein
LLSRCTAGRCTRKIPVQRWKRKRPFLHGSSGQCDAAQAAERSRLDSLPVAPGATIEGMYRVQYQCPRKHGDWDWYDLKGFLGLFQQSFPDRMAAVQAANGLLWQYHGARVLDPWGQVVYQV